jgi:hypothetical protein
MDSHIDPTAHAATTAMLSAARTLLVYVAQDRKTSVR